MSERSAGTHRSKATLRSRASHHTHVTRQSLFNGSHMSQMTSADIQEVGPHSDTVQKWNPCTFMCSLHINDDVCQRAVWLRTVLYSFWELCCKMIPLRFTSSTTSLCRRQVLPFPRLRRMYSTRWRNLHLGMTWTLLPSFIWWKSTSATTI